MNGAGVKNLGDRVITTALTDQVITEASVSGVATGYVAGLGGMVSATVFVDFEYGAGGTTCIVYIQTSLNGTDDWFDVARLDFAQADAQKTVNISAASAAAVAAVAALSVEGKADGILGDRLRAKITTTGTYSSNTSVAVRASVR